TKLIDEIIQKDVPLEDIGSSFYRCLIPFSEVNKNPDLEAIFKDQDPGFWVPFDLPTGTFLITEPLEMYTRGRAVIIGDAAHPIQPTHAQGAVLAIEEAAALESLFKDIHHPESVADRLGLYNDFLKRRIHVTQLLSDAQPGLSSILRQRAEDVWGDGIFPPEAMNFTKPIQDFFYAWDVIEEAENVLALAI
ncbi:6-hydroxynicotinate 3-monooxygenase, partial [Fusarium phyllophilum]